MAAWWQPATLSSWSAAFFRAPKGAVAEIKEAPVEMVIGAWLLAGAVIYFGLDTDLTAGLAGDAAAMLLGGTP